MITICTGCKYYTEKDGCTKFLVPPKDNYHNCGFYKPYKTEFSKEEKLVD